MSKWGTCTCRFPLLRNSEFLLLVVVLPCPVTYSLGPGLHTELVHLLRQLTEATALVSPHPFKTTGGFLLSPPEFSCLAFNDWNLFGGE